MLYVTQNIRRQDRLLEDKPAQDLLKNGEYGVLSMQCGNDDVYAIPISYVWDKKDALYFHCALEGRKLRCLDQYEKVSFCIVGKTKVISEQFTTEYESVVLECIASRFLDEDEKMKALELILDKYSPNDKELGLKYAHKAMHKTEIVRLKIGEWSGKRKKI